MSVTKRMLNLLGEGEAPKTETPPAPVAEEAAVADLDKPGDLVAKAAQVLIVGLSPDLPDDPHAAVDVLIDLMTRLKGNKKGLLGITMRRMQQGTRALKLARQIKKDVE